MDTLPERIGDGRQFVLQSVQFHREIPRIAQGALPAILFVEITCIGLPLDPEQAIRAFRFIASMMMVRHVILGQTPAPCLAQGGA